MRIALLSLLFNWLSTGGGTVHSAKVGKFMTRSGYDVEHFYARHVGWQIGGVEADYGVERSPLDFSDQDWTPAEIQQKFRKALERFNSDHVIVTDSWNTEPILSEAARGYRTYLRLAAQECLCPLNNGRLLIDNESRLTACPKHQLATPGPCRECVYTNQRSSGWLHQRERALAGNRCSA